MIRLALILLLFLGFAVADVAGADPTAQAPAETQERTAEAREPWQGPRLDPAPRWVPRQARRREDLGPAVAPPYPSLLTPTGIPTLSF